MHSKPESGGDDEVAIQTVLSTTTATPKRPTQRPPRPKNLACPHCVRSFDRPSLLSQHILIHTGERPHLCPRCNTKRFSRTSNLYRHMRTCKGTFVASDSSPIDNSPKLPGDGPTSSVSDGPPTLSRSPSPQNSPDSLEEQQLSLASPRYGIKRIRGVTPDPDWGPNPLSSWVPKRRHTITGTFHPVMPISRRVYVPQSSYPLPSFLNSSSSSSSPSSGPSPSTTGSGTGPYTPRPQFSNSTVPSNSSSGANSVNERNAALDINDWSKLWGDPTVNPSSSSNGLVPKQNQAQTHKQDGERENGLLTYGLYSQYNGSTSMFDGMGNSSYTNGTQAHQQQQQQQHAMTRYWMNGETSSDVEMAGDSPVSASSDDYRYNLFEYYSVHAL